MAEESIKWNTTCKRFVAFLDIMGFGDRVFRDSHEKVRKMLESLRVSIESMEKKVRKELKENGTLSADQSDISPIYPVTFSDSLIMISNDDSSRSAKDIILSVSLVFFKAMREGIALKGAIAHGKLTADLDKSLFFGRPLIDAYDLLNELKLYGVVLHHTIEKRIIELRSIGNLSENSYIYKYNVPMKSGNINHYLLDWTIFSRFWGVEAIDLVNKLYSGVSGTPRIYVDNTLEFVREMLKRKQEKKS